MIGVAGGGRLGVNGGELVGGPSSRYTESVRKIPYHRVQNVTDNKMYIPAVRDWNMGAVGSV